MACAVFDDIEKESRVDSLSVNLTLVSKKSSNVLLKQQLAIFIVYSSKIFSRNRCKI